MSAKGQPHAYNLDQLKESDEGTIVVIVCRKWDVHNVNGRNLSTDFVVSDQKKSGVNGCPSKCDAAAIQHFADVASLFENSTSRTAQPFPPL
nr:hypothetical protein [Tanacetum cinerariifolium]